MFIGSSAGPMAAEHKAVKEVMQALLEFDWSKVDKYVVPLQWRQVEVKTILSPLKKLFSTSFRRSEQLLSVIYSQKHPLRIGYYDFDGIFMPLPCIRQAIAEAKTALKEMGHTLVPFRPPGYKTVNTYAHEESERGFVENYRCFVWHLHLFVPTIPPI